MKNPLRNISLYWKCQLLGWGLFGCVDIIFSRQAPPEIRDMMPVSVAIALSHTLICFSVTHLIRLLVKKLKVITWRLTKQAVFFLISLALFSALGALIIVIVNSGFSWFTGNTSMAGFSVQGFMNCWFGVIILFYIWTLFYFLFHFLRNVRVEVQKKADTKIRILELEAHALRAQMNPHFVFNCLNSIKSLIQDDQKDKSVTYLTTFSRLIRTLFNNADKKEISLYDEIETCKLYLELEAMRFDTKFSCAVNIDEDIDLKSIHVPALIIQPFIENAIWHGIMPKGTGGHVLVDVSMNNGTIEVAIDDNGIGREASKENKTSTNIAHQSKGVNLTQSRLELDNLLQKRKGSLEITDKKDENGKSCGTKVVIRLTYDS